MAMTKEERIQCIQEITEHLQRAQTRLSQFLSQSPEATAIQRAATDVIRETRAYVKTAIQVIEEVRVDVE